MGVAGSGTAAHSGITVDLAPGADKLQDGAGQLADGATQLDGGAAQLADGTGELAAGTVQLKGYRGANNNPEAGTGTAALAQALQLLQAAASDPVQDLVPLSVVKGKIAKIAAGARKLDAGATQLLAACSRAPASCARGRGSWRLVLVPWPTERGHQGWSGGSGQPRLLNGSLALASGASGLSAGNTKLASGSSQLSTGADKLADGNAVIAESTGTLYSSAAAVSPSNRVRQSDAAMALGIVGVLGLGSVGAFFVLRKKQNGTAAV
jgi:putative membrane protein